MHNINGTTLKAAISKGLNGMDLKRFKLSPFYGKVPTFYALWLFVGPDFHSYSVRVTIFIRVKRNQFLEENDEETSTCKMNMQDEQVLCDKAVFLMLMQTLATCACRQARMAGNTFVACKAISNV